MHQVLDMDERVFFHLSEVLPDDNNSNNMATTPAAAAGGGGGSAPTDKDSSGDGVAESAPDVEGTPSTAAGNGNAKPTPIIKRGQEVAFRIGQRQGKPLGLRVRKLRQGTLPTEESLPCRFVGVVVVPPRNVGPVDKEKVQQLVLLWPGAVFVVGQRYGFQPNRIHPERGLSLSLSVERCTRYRTQWRVLLAWKECWSCCRRNLPLRRLTTPLQPRYAATIGVRRLIPPAYIISLRLESCRTWGDGSSARGSTLHSVVARETWVAALAGFPSWAALSFLFIP